MAYLVPKLANHVIAVTRGADRVFTVVRRDAAGDPVDWDASLALTVSTSTPITVAATVDGSAAVVRIESTVCDQVRTGTMWQLVMSQSGVPTLETPIMVGTFERNYGK